VQLAIAALVGWHTTPQAPQLLGVLSVVQVPLHVVSRQVHVPFEQSGVGCAQVVWFTHWPMLPHVWVVCPLQLSWPGAQEPVQEPL
jgi:hypothetical protein